MKLNLTSLVVGDAELTKRQCLHHNTTISTPAATIIIAATINSTAKDTNMRILGNITAVLN